MAVKGLEETQSKLDQVKQFGGVVLIAIIAAVLIVGVLILSGTFQFIPSTTIRVLGFTIPPEYVTLLSVFTLAFAVVIGYVYMLQLIKSTFGKIKRKWLDLSQTIQAATFGLQAGILAGVSLYLTHVYLFAFQLITLVGLSVAAFVVLTYATMKVWDMGWGIREWAKAVYMSILVGALLATLSTFAFIEIAPGYMPPALFLGGWAICNYLLFRRKHAVEDSYISKVLTQTGYAQMRQVDTVSVSIGTGLVLAIVVAAVVGYFGTQPSGLLQRVALSVVLVWPVVTIATSIGWPSTERTDLVIEDINVRSSTNQRELTVRNHGDRPIDLHQAKIRDAHDTLYYVGIRASLTPGEAGRFEIPESFELAAHDRYDVYSLPKGFALMKEAEEPEIITRDGAVYVLYWVDQLPQAQGSSTPDQQPATA